MPRSVSITLTEGVSSFNRPGPEVAFTVADYRIDWTVLSARAHPPMVNLPDGEHRQDRDCPDQLRRRRPRRQRRQDSPILRPCSHRRREPDPYPGARAVRLPPRRSSVTRRFLSRLQRRARAAGARGARHHSRRRASARRSGETPQRRIRRKGRADPGHVLQARPPELHRVRRGTLLRSRRPSVRLSRGRDPLRRKHLRDTWGPQGPLTTRPDAVSIGINICADAWGAKAPQAAREAGAQVLLVLNASPYHMRKQESRYDVMRERVTETGMALVYANMVGGQDELVFDGASFALDRRGEVVCQLPVFEETLEFVTVVDGEPQRGGIAEQASLESEVYKALCLGVRDYVGKNGFPGALVGLSGGVDSALTL